MTRVALALATGLYSGYAPVAPGTVGSMVGLLVFGAVRTSGSVAVEGAVLCGLLGLGVWSATVTARVVGRSDPGIIVIDEVVGMLVTLAFVPAGWGTALAGFLLFRLFDIVKPYPVRRLERLPDGLGVVLDDVGAGLYAHMVLRGLLWAVGAA